MSEQVLTGITTKKDRHGYYNTLTGLVKALERTITTVDLRNESSVSGTIVGVDGQMNIDMENVVFIDPRGAEHAFPQFFVSNRNIRYVHVPNNLNAEELIEGQLARMSRTSKPKTKRPHTLKTVRAERRQKEIVRSAFGSGSTLTTT